VGRDIYGTMLHIVAFRHRQCGEIGSVRYYVERNSSGSDEKKRRGGQFV
jgi:hypothetical protein